MPTEKSQSIENLLTSLSGISRQDAFKQVICTWCKRPIEEFRDLLSQQEYRISGFCQQCQDSMFGDCDEQVC